MFSIPPIVWKAIGIFLLVAFILSLIGGLKYYKDQAEQNAIGRDEAIRIANRAEQETDIYRNKLGDTVRITQAAELNLKNFKAIAKTDELAWINKFEGLKKSYKNLESAGTIDVSLQSGLLIPDTIKIPCDSTGFKKAFRFKLKDDWNDIEATVLDSPRFKIKDKLYWVVEWQRAHKFWFIKWGKKEYKKEITNSNPLINIDGQSVFIIRKKSD